MSAERAVQPQQPVAQPPARWTLYVRCKGDVDSSYVNITALPTDTVGNVRDRILSAWELNTFRTNTVFTLIQGRNSTKPTPEQELAGTPIEDNLCLTLLEAGMTDGCWVTVTVQRQR
jgi:hypothetical protein